MSLPDAPLALDTIVFDRGLRTPPGVHPSLSGIDPRQFPRAVRQRIGVALRRVAVGRPA